MGLISQLKTWSNLEVLTHTALNAEIAQLINTINALGNANWSAAGTDDLDGQKVNVETNSIFLAEHSAVGGHSAFANVNVDMGYIYRNAAAPDSKVDIVFNRITVYSSDTITTRLRKLIQGTGATTLVADIGAANGINALDTGSVAASTTYYIWVIYKSAATATTASLLSLESTIAGLTLPTDYDYGLLMGSVDTDADSDFLAPKSIPGVSSGKFVSSFEKAKDLSTNGYMQFGNGLILQWGLSAAVGANNDVVVTFPLAFPTACLNVTTNAYETSQSTANTYVRAAPNTTQVTLHTSSSVGVDGIYWIAIGH